MVGWQPTVAWRLDFVTMFSVLTSKLGWGGVEAAAERASSVRNLWTSLHLLEEEKSGREKQAKPLKNHSLFLENVSDMVVTPVDETAEDMHCSSCTIPLLLLLLSTSSKKNYRPRNGPPINIHAEDYCLQQEAEINKGSQESNQFSYVSPQEGTPGMSTPIQTRISLCHVLHLEHICSWISVCDIQARNQGGLTIEIILEVNPRMLPLQTIITTQTVVIEIWPIEKPGRVMANFLDWC